MSGLKSVMACVAGFAAMVITVMLLTFTLVRLPGMTDSAGGPTTVWLAVNLSYGFLCAGLGGWVAAHLAPRARFGHGAALAGFIVLTYFLGGGQPQPGQPEWYPLVNTSIAVCGILAGARLRDQRG